MNTLSDSSDSLPILVCLFIFINYLLTGTSKYMKIYGKDDKLLT
jgi:hypothetical protein